MKLKRRIFAKSSFKVSERLRFQRVSLFLLFVLVILLLGPMGIWLKSTDPKDYKAAALREQLLEKIFSFNALTENPQSRNDFLREHFELEERNHQGLIVGAEKKVHFPAGTEAAFADLGLVYFHGFQANRQELAPVVEEVAEAIKAPIFFSRINHHGMQGGDLRELKLDDYLEAIIEAEVVGRHLGAELAVIGMSTGAPMAMLMAAQSTQVKSLVLISPNFALRQWNWKLAIGPIGNVLTRIVKGPEHKWTPINDQQAKFWAHRIHSGALRPMAEMVQLGRRAGEERKDWSQVSVLLVQNPLDQIIDNEESKAYLEQFSFQRFEVFELPSDNHILAGNIVKPENTAILVERIRKFVSESKTEL